MHLLPYSQVACWKCGKRHDRQLLFIVGRHPKCLSTILPRGHDISLSIFTASRLPFRVQILQPLQTPQLLVQLVCLLAHALLLSILFLTNPLTALYSASLTPYHFSTELYCHSCTCGRLPASRPKQSWDWYPLSQVSISTAISGTVTLAVESYVFKTLV